MIYYSKNIYTEVTEKNVDASSSTHLQDWVNIKKMAQSPVKFPLPCRALLGKTQCSNFKHIFDIGMTSLDLFGEIYKLVFFLLLAPFVIR